MGIAIVDSEKSSGKDIDAVKLASIDAIITESVDEIVNLGFKRRRIGH